MTISSQIQALCVTAEQRVSQILDSPDQSLLPPDVVDQVRKAYDQFRTAANTPVTVGFVGGFTTGKSVLIGSLLGIPDLLPAKNEATTGNVTEIRPIPIEDGQQPRIVGPVEIRYFDTSTVQACRSAMVQTLDADARAFHLPSPPPGDDWSALTQWCQTVAWARQDMRPRIRELMNLRDAIHRHPEFATGIAQKASWEMVRKNLLTIGSATTIGEPVWWPIPQPHPMPLGIEADDAMLRRASVLVDRVVVDIEVPRRFWPLDLTRISDKVVLLDFPGRGAAPSEMRDEFLRTREFRTLNMIVLMLDPDRVDATDPAEIRKEFERSGVASSDTSPISRRDAIMTIISRFDRYDQDAPSVFAGKGSVSLANVLGDPDLGGLRQLWQHADMPPWGQPYTGSPHPSGCGPEVTMVSVAASWALSGRHDPPPFSPPATRPLVEWRDSICRHARIWGGLAERIVGGDMLARPLREYASDGGLSRLRSLVTRRAEVHGLAQKYHRVKAAMEELDDGVTRAQAELESAIIARAVAGSEERNALDHLLSQVRRELETSATRSVADVLSPSFLLPDAMTGVDRVRRVVTTAVLDWPEWEQLLDVVTDEIVRPGDSRVINDTRELVDPFIRTLSHARQVGWQTADAMVFHWISQRTGELKDILVELQRQIKPLKESLSKDPTTPKILHDLARSTQLQWTWDGTIPAEDDSTHEGDEEGLFPLRVGRALPWHPNRLSIDHGTGKERHQIHVMRIRRELTAAVVRVGHKAMADRLKVRTYAVQGKLKELQATLLPTRRDIDRFLDIAFGPIFHDPFVSPSGPDFEPIEEI